MATLVTMPKLGLTMNSGSIAEWKKKEGESIAKGEPFFVVATDKLTFDVESPEEGVLLKILVHVHEDVPVGTPLAVVGQVGEDYTSLLEEKDIVKSGSRDSMDISSSVSTRLVKASPLAKKTARDLGIDISEIKGTGPEGRVVKKDVVAFSQAVPLVRGAKASPAACKMASDLGVDLATIDKEGRIMKEDVAAALLSSQKSLASAQIGKRIPLTNMRKVIGERMLLSATTIPSVTYNMDVDFSQLITMRQTMNKGIEKRGIKISFNDIFMKICAQALLEFPMTNASLEEQEVVLHENVNIGLAVAVEGGLVVPNIKAVQDKSLLQIALESADIVERARSNRLELEEMQGGTFTITNLGMFGVHNFTPIINPPEACILGINAIVEKAVVVGGEIKVLPISTLSVSADHRLVDGADAAKFIARIKELAENPYLLLL